MTRQYLSPKGHWSLPFPVTHKHGVRDGEMIFVGGQVDLGSEGGVRHPASLSDQTEGTLDNVAAVLREGGADLDDVVKLVVFYVNRGEVDERALLEQIRRRIGHPVPPAVAAVPLPALAWPDLKVEIEAIAMRAPDGERLPREAANPATHWEWPFSHGLRCGELIFVGTQMPLDAEGRVREAGDVVAQARINIENLDKVLAAFGAERGDVCRINTFYVGYGTATDWARAGAVRGNAFAWPGPVGTGVPVPALFPDGVTQRQEAFAMRGVDGARLPRVALRPEGHWDWPTPVNFQQVVKVGRMVFVGGQVSAQGAGNVLYPSDLEAQTHEVMRDIERSLAAVGAKLDDVVKLNSFYKGGADRDYPRRYATIRSSYFRDPGPTTTGVPLPKIAVLGLELEIEAYAMVGG
jgi:enamine deaminase RidA (YjgF/YER057c/UK114 family)